MLGAIPTQVFVTQQPINQYISRPTSQALYGHKDAVVSLGDNAKRLAVNRNHISKTLSFELGMTFSL